jgi:hypothetical protein
MLLNKKRMRKHRKKNINLIKTENKNQRKIIKMRKINNQTMIDRNRKIVQMKIIPISLLWETVEMLG